MELKLNSFGLPNKAKAINVRLVLPIRLSPPITVPIVLAGEPNNFALEKAFNESSGLIRRVFTLLLKREEHLEDVWNEIDNVIFPALNKNYGFVIKHLSAFQ